MVGIRTKDHPNTPLDVPYGSPPSRPARVGAGVEAGSSGMADTLEGILIGCMSLLSLNLGRVLVRGGLTAGGPEGGGGDHGITIREIQ